MEVGRGISLLAVGALALGGCGTGPAATTPAGSSGGGATIPASSAAVRTPDVTAPPAPTPDVTVRDGEAWVVYQWVAGSGDGIYLVRPDGTGNHRVASGAGASQIHPDWSPDGSMIAFVSITGSDQARLWVVDADGENARELYACDQPCVSVEYPDWSADGSAIYFNATADAGPGGIPTTFQVARFDLDPGEVTVVLDRRDGMTAEQARVSPDEQHLVYTRYVDPVAAAPGSAIFVSDIDGKNERRLTPFDGYGAYPDWSLNDQIVFNTRDLGAFQEAGQEANLFLMDPDGGNLVQLTTFAASEGRATQPRWTHDGAAILFTKVVGTGSGQRTIGVVGADGSGLGSFLASGGVRATHPQLRPLPS